MPESIPARPFLIPIRQPTLPELQSVSQPQVLMIFMVSEKSSSPCIREMNNQGVVGHHMAVAAVFIISIDTC